ncbi:MAG: hypothetical protein AAGD07_16205 [Planctomycetota bacterium]
MFVPSRVRDDIGERVIGRVSATDGFFPKCFRSATAAANGVVRVTLAAGLTIGTFGEKPLAKVVSLVWLETVDPSAAVEVFQQRTGCRFVVLDRRRFPLWVESTELGDPLFKCSTLACGFA